MLLKSAVSEVSSYSWDFERDVRFYAEAGAGAISVLGDKVDAYGLEPARKLLAAHALDVAAYASLGPFPLYEPERWDVELEGCRRRLACAAELGAPLVEVLTGSGRGRPYAESEAALSAWLDRLVPIAEQNEVVIAFEHNHALRVDLGFIHSLHDALDFTEAFNSPHLRVCCEVNNAWIERFLYDDIRERGELIGIIQISDFAEGTLATPERVPLGDGIIPLQRILSAFHRSPFDGYYEVELIGPEVERLGYETSIRRSLDFLAAFEPLPSAD